MNEFNRRDFLKTTAMAGAGAFLGKERTANAETGQNAEEIRMLNLSKQMAHDLQINKLPYKKDTNEFKEITEDIKNLIEKLLKYEKAVNSMPNPAIAESLRKPVWESLSTFFPGRQYSKDNFFKTNM